MRIDNDTINQRAAAEVREIAHRRGVSYNTVLDELEISTSTLHHWARGQGSIGAEFIRRIGELGGDVYGIITGEERERTYTIDEVRDAMAKAAQDVENGLPADMIHVSDYLPIG